MWIDFDESVDIVFDFWFLVFFFFGLVWFGIVWVWGLYLISLGSRWGDFGPPRH